MEVEARQPRRIEVEARQPRRIEVEARRFPDVKHEGETTLRSRTTPDVEERYKLNESYFSQPKGDQAGPTTLSRRAVVLRTMHDVVERDTVLQLLFQINEE